MKEISSEEINILKQRLDSLQTKLDQMKARKNNRSWKDILEELKQKKEELPILRRKTYSAKEEERLAVPSYNLFCIAERVQNQLPKSTPLNLQDYSIPVPVLEAEAFVSNYAEKIALNTDQNQEIARLQRQVQSLKNLPKSPEHHKKLLRYWYEIIEIYKVCLREKSISIWQTPEYKAVAENHTQAQKAESDLFTQISKLKAQCSRSPILKLDELERKLIELKTNINNADSSSFSKYESEYRTLEEEITAIQKNPKEAIKKEMQDYLSNKLGEMIQNPQLNIPAEQIQRLEQRKEDEVAGLRHSSVSISDALDRIIIAEQVIRDDIESERVHVKIQRYLEKEWSALVAEANNLVGEGWMTQLGNLVKQMDSVVWKLRYRRGVTEREELFQDIQILGGRLKVGMQEVKKLNQLKDEVQIQINDHVKELRELVAQAQKHHFLGKQSGAFFSEKIGQLAVLRQSLPVMKEHIKQLENLKLKIDTAIEKTQKERNISHYLNQLEQMTEELATFSPKQGILAFKTITDFKNSMSKLTAEECIETLTKKIGETQFQLKNIARNVQTETEAVLQRSDELIQALAPDQQQKWRENIEICKDEKSHSPADRLEAAKTVHKHLERLCAKPEEGLLARFSAMVGIFGKSGQEKQKSAEPAVQTKAQTATSERQAPPEEFSLNS
jgi:hypothetical protein